MKDQKHTPGPWIHIQTSLTAPFYVYRKNSQSAKVIATIPFHDNPRAGTNLYSAAKNIRQCADAALIAAAPELLEAAESLILELEQSLAYGCFDGFGKRDQESAKAFYNRPEIKALVKAIIKARGDK